MGRINYNRPRGFKLQDVARICNKLYNTYTEKDTDFHAPDSTLHYLWRLFSDWMQFRGLYDTIYGAHGGLDWYLEFLTWFDGFVSAVEKVSDIVIEIIPELGPYIEMLKRATSLYKLVRSMQQK